MTSLKVVNEIVVGKMDYKEGEVESHKKRLEEPQEYIRQEGEEKRLQAMVQRLSQMMSQSWYRLGRVWVEEVEQGGEMIWKYQYQEEGQPGV